jgi:hypothetical protein
LLVEHACPRERGSERFEQINADGALLIDELKQRLAFWSVWMNVIEQESIGERSGDCAKAIDDQIHIVHGASAKGATMGAQLHGHGDTASQGEGAKATRQQLLNDVSGSPGVVGCQDCREHNQ